MFLGGKKVCDPKKQFVTQRGEEMRAHQVAAWGSDGKTTPPVLVGMLGWKTNEPSSHVSLLECAYLVF